MLEFAWPLVALAAILPWLVATVAPAARPLAAPLRVPFLEQAERWQRAATGGPRRVRHGLVIAAWLALVVAACRPQWIGEPVSVPASGRSMLLALDLSGSIRDIALGGEPGPELLRRTARTFIAGRAGDRIGLIVFGSKAHLQAPPTSDLRALSELVDEAFIGLAGDGTALGDAIALGVARLRTTPGAGRVLVLLTDGSSTEGVLTVPEAAELAREHAVRVYSIGLGAPAVPGAQRAGVGLDEASLKLISAQTGGLYFRADSAGALERIYEALAQHEPVAGDARRYRSRTELYAWPLAMALLLAFGALAAGGRLARRWRR
ncbi:MAG TPA: VWA domain-containing protein [Burkholderiales bacterium]|nr:VWA domain-containing protein [Burkholderiales bacterium]